MSFPELKLDGRTFAPFTSIARGEKAGVLPKEMTIFKTAEFQRVQLRGKCFVKNTSFSEVSAPHLHPGFVFLAQSFAAHLCRAKSRFLESTLREGLNAAARGQCSRGICALGFADLHSGRGARRKRRG